MASFTNLSGVRAKCTALLVAALLMPTIGHSQEVNSRSDIEQIVREYLLENPEILFEMQSALEEKQQLQVAAQQKEILQTERSAIFEAPFQIEFGNADAKVTIVEFFDYNCGFCQRAMSDMQQILDESDDVRFILKEFPVLGEQSMGAARVSMAFSLVMPEKQGEFHIALLGTPGVKDAETALGIAESLGAGREEIVSKMEDPDIIATISETYRLADGLGITGTPSYIVGDKVVFGAIGYDALKEEMSSQVN